MSPIDDYKTVKCSECGNIIRTKKNDTCQCPKSSGGCGARLKVKECLVKI